MKRPAKLTLWKELGWKVHREKIWRSVSLARQRQKTWRKLAQYLIHPFEHRLPEHLRDEEKDLIVVEEDINAIYSEEIGLIKNESASTPASNTIFA
jgi:hypothetical protein